ncbi:hypothetical protein AAIA72_15525 [Hahella sp. SMD15-11]|uniref:Ubiquinone biosynthesis accessory factor UbiJ n=1 Tax=Thermohahella caldifontis TaxID=3142973 RepID=A0AB39UW32_9GAMM
MSLDTTRTATAIALENLLNRLAELDLGVYARLHALEGRLIRIEVRPLPDALWLQPGRPLRVLAAADDADGTLKGTPLTLIRFLTGQPGEPPAWEGPEDLFQALHGIFQIEEPDLQPLLARLTGKTPAEFLAPLFNEGTRLLRQVKRQFLEDVREYLLNDSGLVPHPEAVNALERDAHALASRTDELEARIAAIEARLKDRKA